MTLSERIAQARIRSGLKQEQLAKSAGVSGSAVAQWETGETKRIRSENIFPVARALGVDPEWLATGKGEQYPKAKSPHSAYIVHSLDERHKELLALFDRIDLKRQAALLEFLKNFD